MHHRTGDVGESLQKEHTSMKRTQNDKSLHTDFTGPKRRRTALACNRCRSRKVKCDGGYPSCYLCHDNGMRCEYRNNQTEVAEVIEVTPDNTHALEQRLKLLEETVSRLRQPSSSPAEGLHEGTSPQLVIKELPDDSSTVHHLSFVDDRGSPGLSGDDFYGPSSNIFYLREILKGINSVTLASFRGADNKFLAFIQPQSSPPAAVFHADPVPGVQNASKDELYALPPLQATLYLVSLFFRDYGSMNPFLDEATFIPTHVDPIYDEAKPPDPSTLALLNMVLAIATASSMDSIKPAMRRLYISRLFFERSKGLLSEHALECGNLKQVQAYLLMGQYLQSTDRCSDAWSTHSMAVQKALRQGLHNQDHSADVSDEKVGAQRRTWQLCLFMDSAFSMHFGRPSLLGAFKHQADLLMDKPTFNRKFGPPLSKSGPRKDSTGFFYHSFSLYALLGRIVSTDLFQSIRPLNVSQFMDVIASTVCLGRDLDNWLQNLPQIWRDAVLSSPAASQDAASSRSDLGMVLSLRYHNVHLMLHRPVLLLALSAARESTNDEEPRSVPGSQLASYSRPSLDASMESVQSIVAIVNAFDGRKPGPGMWWTLIQIVYNATLTCFAVIRLHTNNSALGRPQIVSEARASLDLARQSFSKLIPEQPAVERASTFVQHILQLCDHIVQQSVSAALISSLADVQSSRADVDQVEPDSLPFDLSMFEDIYYPLLSSR